MKILTVSGSSRKESTNVKLLDSFPELFPEHFFVRYDKVHELPVFSVGRENNPLAELVKDWKLAISKSDAIIICTPEYIHNIPAAIKNALEWVTTSGELMGKPVLPITFTPHEPRGEKAMQSLIWSLQALDARIVTQLPLYQNEVSFNNDGKIENGEIKELIFGAIEMLLI